MSCGPTATGRAFNADLIDLVSDSSLASQQLAPGIELPCPFPTAELIALASVALLLHSILLVLVSAQLGRLVLRYHSSRVERWWSTFAGRYLLLALLTSGCAVLFCCLRLTGLSGRLSVDVSASPLLSVSFSPRASATYGMSVLLFIAATSIIGATAYSVYNTLHATLHSARLLPGSQTAQLSLPWHIRHVSSLAWCLVAWNAAVWAAVFLLPTAARSCRRRRLSAPSRSCSSRWAM